MHFNDSLALLSPSDCICISFTIFTSVSTSQQSSDTFNPLCGCMPLWFVVTLDMYTTHDHIKAVHI